MAVSSSALTAPFRERIDSPAIDWFRKLRNSEFGVLAKFPTQSEACTADYPDVPEMPWYLEDVDAFILPLDLWRLDGYEDFERIWEKQRAIFLINHGHEFGTRVRFVPVKSTPALIRFVEAHRDEIVFVRYGDFMRTMHERVHGNK